MKVVSSPALALGASVVFRKETENKGRERSSNTHQSYTGGLGFQASMLTNDELSQ
jgi:hypothetical protein